MSSIKEGRQKPRLYDSVTVLAGVWLISCATLLFSLLRARPRAKQLAMITTRKSIRWFSIAPLENTDYCSSPAFIKDSMEFGHLNRLSQLNSIQFRLDIFHPYFKYKMSPETFCRFFISFQVESISPEFAHEITRKLVILYLEVNRILLKFETTRISSHSKIFFCNTLPTETRYSISSAISRLNSLK